MKSSNAKCEKVDHNLFKDRLTDLSDCPMSNNSNHYQMVVYQSTINY